MTKYIKRQTTLIDLPVNDIAILKPEQIILRFGKYGTLDIGSFCYLDRCTDSARLSNNIKLVNINTLNKQRCEHIRKIIQIISEKINSSLSLSTISTYCKKFIYFIDWADINNESNFLENKDKSREVFFNYINYLKDKLIQNHFVSSSATARQNATLMFLEEFHNTENLAKGISLISENRGEKQTSPPSEDSQNKVLSLCESLFEGITDLILNHKTFPYKLKVPEHIGWNNNTFNIFPIVEWAVNPINFREKQGLMWNQLEGRLSTKEEAKVLYPNFRTRSLSFIKTNKILSEANSDKYFKHRIRLAMVAQYAFSIIFLATTGMNKESLIELLWDDEYEISSDRQSFRTIKHRAGNKVCYFEISSGMLPKFKKFLELRKYLLNKNKCDYLFFQLGADFSQIPKCLGVGTFTSFFNTLKYLDSSIPNITPKEWRAAKSDWLIKNTDVSTASLILQNSERVLLNHYAAGSETEQFSEISKFFNEVSNFVIQSNEKIIGEASSVGICSSYGNPIAINNAPVKVNCKSPEGCLFCDKYRVHADEKDVRKLISCRYCLQKTSQLSQSKESFDKVFGVIFKRIDDILNQIEKLNPGLTIKVTKEVEEMGELDSYWAKKLELLFDLGLVS